MSDSVYVNRLKRYRKRGIDTSCVTNRKHKIKAARMYRDHHDRGLTVRDLMDRYNLSDHMVRSLLAREWKIDHDCWPPLEKAKRKWERERAAAIDSALGMASKKLLRKYGPDFRRMIRRCGLS